MRYQAAIKRRLLRLLSIILVAAVFLGTTALSGCTQTGDREVLVTVNGEQITKDSLYREMYAQVGQEALESLISQTLILQEGRKHNIEVSPAEIEARLHELIESGFASKEHFLDTLEAFGLSLEDIERQVLIQLTAEKLLAAEIYIDEDEARAYFETHREQFGQPKRLQARHIVVETREEAEAVREALASGADFEELAGEKSIDTFTAGSGGNLGVIHYTETLPPWQLALFDLEVGTLSDVLEGPGGYHVVEVLDTLPAEDPSFEEVQDKVERLLMEKNMQMLYPAWLESLRAKATIEYAK
mgnify:CR=1 FL=1